MALKRVELKRKFVVSRNNSTIELTDPNSSMTPQDVMDFYASAGYPELNNASVVGPVTQDDSLVYTFKTVVGTKG